MKVAGHLLCMDHSVGYWVTSSCVCAYVVGTDT